MMERYGPRVCNSQRLEDVLTLIAMSYLAEVLASVPPKVLSLQQRT